MPDPSPMPAKEKAEEQKEATKLHPSAEGMVRRVGKQQSRMIRGRADADHSFWRALAILGVVGWSVTFPTLAGVALGIWIDRRWPSPISWTLTLLFIGLVIGCVHAWTRIKEDRKE
jgi:ATP synthase protein I